MERPRGHRGQSEPAAQRKTAPEPPPEPQRGGPIDDALHTVGKVAGTGVAHRRGPREGSSAPPSPPLSL